MPTKVFFITKMGYITDSTLRQAWIDQFRGVLFFFVIVFHTFQSPLWLRHFFDFFFLSGFYFLSGFLFKPKGIKKNLLGIVNSLLIPFLIFSFIISFYNMIISMDAQIFLDSFIDYFIMGGDGIWFIPCLIVLETVFTLVVNSSKNYVMNIVVIVSLVCFLLVYIIADGSSHHLPWNVDTCIIALPIFSAGFLMKSLDFLPKVLVVSSFIFFCAITQIMGNTIYVSVNVDLHNNVIGDPFVYIILSLLGSYTIFSLCRILPTGWFFTKLGQYTLFAFPFHPFAYRTIVKGLKYLGAEGAFIILVIAPLLTGLTMIIVCIFLEKYAPYIIGKYKYIKNK